jgi:hypothetical protein
MSRQFTRTIEDFTCGHCGFKVKGSGYTNHCPKCLWSKHVDINPGDRAEICQGMMKPIGVEKNGPDIYIVQRCQNCKTERRIKQSPDDNYDLILELSANI